MPNYCFQRNCPGQVKDQSVLRLRLLTEESETPVYPSRLLGLYLCETGLTGWSEDAANPGMRPRLLHTRLAQIDLCLKPLRVQRDPPARVIGSRASSLLLEARMQTRLVSAASRLLVRDTAKT